jgi:hypothetical protein
MKYRSSVEGIGLGDFDDSETSVGGVSVEALLAGDLELGALLTLSADCREEPLTNTDLASAGSTSPSLSDELSSVFSEAAALALAAWFSSTDFCLGRQTSLAEPKVASWNFDIATAQLEAEL